MLYKNSLEMDHRLECKTHQKENTEKNLHGLK